MSRTDRVIKILKAIFSPRIWKPVVSDAMFYCGPAATIYGIWQIHKPTAWIIGGILMSIGGMFVDKLNEGKKKSNGDRSESN